MKKIKALPLAAIVLITFFAAQTAFSQVFVSEDLSAKFDDLSNPGVVKITWRNGDVEIIGRNTDEVRVEVSGRSERSENKRDTRGLRRVFDGDAVNVEKTGNSIMVSSFSTIKSVDAVIYVPENAEIRFENELNGDVTVESMKSEISVQTLNGEIYLKNLTSPVTAYSVNGDIEANFTNLDFNQPLSFSTLNSDIDLTFPATLKATAEMSTNKEIYIDETFEIERKGSRFRRSSRSRSVYDINGGGMDIEIKSLNGALYVRKDR